MENWSQSQNPALNKTTLIGYVSIYHQVLGLTNTARGVMIGHKLSSQMSPAIIWIIMMGMYLSDVIEVNAFSRIFLYSVILDERVALWSRRYCISYTILLLQNPVNRTVSTTPGKLCKLNVFSLSQRFSGVVF